MRILILSDIHANWPALQAVLAAEPDRDGVICLGDLVNYGPHPARCVRWASIHVSTDWIVQGNHDRALGCAEDPRCSAAYRSLAAAMQPYTAGRLNETAKGYLAALPGCQTNSIGHARFFLCHAVPSDPCYGYLQPEDSADRWKREVHTAGTPNFLLVGHTHRPFVRRIDSTMIVNPGSVGQPKDGDPRAAYAIWDDGHVRLCRAVYDIEAVARDLVDRAPPEVAQALAGILRTGGTLASETANDPTP